MSCRAVRFIALCLAIMIISISIVDDSCAYNVEKALETGLMNSKSLKAAKKSVDVANGRFRAGKYDAFVPAVSLDAVRSDNMDTHVHTHNSEISVKYNVFSGFRNINNIKISEIDQYESVLNLQNETAHVVSDIIKHYESRLLDSSKLKLRKKQKDLMKVKLQEVTFKHSKGIVNSTDLAEAYAQDASANALYIAAYNQNLKSIAAFETAIGAKISDSLEPVDEKLVNSLVPKSLEICKSLAIELNPDIARGKLAVKRLEAKHNIKKGAMFPTVDAVGSIKNNDKGVKIAVSMPIFRPSIQSEIGASKDEYLVGLEQYRIVRDNVMNKVTDCWFDYISAKDMLRFYEKNMTAKGKMVESMNIEYNVGTKTMSDYMRAVTEHVDSEVQLMDHRKKIIDKAVNLLYTVGTLNGSNLVPKSFR